MSEVDPIWACTINFAASSNKTSLAPDEIYAFFGTSKKAFKMNVGMLYKLKLITIEDGGIRLMPEVIPPSTSI